MRRDLSPRGYGRILDDAVELYRANWKTLAGVSLMVVGPFALIMSIAQVFYMRGFMAAFTNIQTMAADPARFSRLLTTSMIAQSATPLYSIAMMVTGAVILRAAPALHAGEKRTVRELFPGAWRAVWMYAAAYFLVVTAAEFGLLLFIVPGVVLGLRLALAPAVAVIEGAPIVESFKRSWRLTERTWPRLIGFWVCFAVINFGVEAAINSPAAVRQLVDSIQDPQAVFRELSVGWKVVEGLLSAASVSVALPFGTLAYYLLYVDVRARAEGMDLFARARELTGEA